MDRPQQGRVKSKVSGSVAAGPYIPKRIPVAGTSSHSSAGPAELQNVRPIRGESLHEFIATYSSARLPPNAAVAAPI